MAETLGIERVGVVVNQGANNYPGELNAVANTLLPEFNSLSIGTEMKMAAIHPCPPREIYASPQYTEVVEWLDNLPNTDPFHPCLVDPVPPSTASDAEWEEWEWRWTQMDSIATYAKDNNLGIFGHSLVFHQSIPGWLEVIHTSHLPFDQQVSADVELIMKDHIETVMEHYCEPQFLNATGQPVVYAYDVVNEATRGDAYADDYIYEVTPFIRINTTNTYTISLDTNHYVREAFTHARVVLNDAESQITPEVSPCLGKDIQLVYNDKGTQTTQTWANGIYLLAQSLTRDLDTNEPLEEPLIDVVGFQMHIAMYPEAQNLEDYLPTNFDNIQLEMERVADLGVEIIVSELDVALRRYADYCGWHPDDRRKIDCSLADPDNYFDYPATPEPTENRRSQAWVYQYVVEACRNVPQCTGITFWGLHDENSWLKEFHPHMFNQMPPVIYGVVTPTPTNTPTPTPNSATDPAPTPTPTRTPTVTLTPSPTLSTSHDPSVTNTPTPTPSRTSTPNPRMTPKPAYYAVRTALAAPTYTPTLTATATPTGQPLLPTATGTNGGYPPPVTNTPVSYP